MLSRLCDERYAPGIVLGIIIAVAFLACAALADAPLDMQFVKVAAPGGVANPGDVQPNGTFGSVGHDYR